ncbi:hypothetical protein ACWD5R_11300 [Streptomyces sp. NPDC002514]|uniref:hypothetical protein n=1 Tax=Streptomyces sp. NPDC001270 TaxID=3364554 RepID=UPI003686DCA2
MTTVVELEEQIVKLEEALEDTESKLAEVTEERDDLKREHHLLTEKVADAQHLAEELVRELDR